MVPSRGIASHDRCGVTTLLGAEQASHIDCVVVYNPISTILRHVLLSQIARSPKLELVLYT